MWEIAHGTAAGQSNVCILDGCDTEDPRLRLTCAGICIRICFCVRNVLPIPRD